MIKAPKVTIIVLNCNGLGDTRKCLRSLFKAKYSSFDVLLVDNGSKVNEAKILQREFKDKRLKFLRFNKNWGFAGGNNRAIKKSKSKYVVFLNNDTVVDPNWIDGMVCVVETDPNIVGCQAKILSLCRPEYFEFAGAAGGFLDRLGYPYARGRVGFHLEKDLGQYDQVVDIFWASGTCLLVTRKLFLELGGFDQDFIAYQEEIDFCWRAKRAGFRIVFCPEAVVFHKGMGVTISRLEWKTYLVHRNNLKLIIKNLPLFSLVWILPIRLVLDWVGMLFYLITGRYKFVLSVMKAHLETFCAFKKELLKRRELEKSIPYYNNKEFLPISIYWEYFVNGKRRFNEILGKKGRAAPVVIYEDLLSLKRITALKRSHTSVLNTLLTKKVFLLSFVVIIALLLRLPSLTLPLDRDEGTYAYIGWVWRTGQGIPYLSVFDHKPPLPYLVYAFLSYIGGNTLLSIRVGSMFYFFATLLIFYYFTCRWWGKWTSTLLSLILLYLISSTSVEGWGFNTEVLFIPWVLLTFGLVKESINANGKTSLYYWFLVGIIGGIAGLFKQVAYIPIIGLFISLGVWMWISKKKELKKIILFGLGIAIPNLATLAYFYFQGGLKPYIATNFFFNRIYLADGLILKNVQTVTGLSGTIFPYIKWLVGIRYWEVKFAIALFAVSCYLFFKHKRWLELAGGVILVGGLLAGAKLTGVREVGHYYLPLIWGATFSSGGLRLVQSRTLKKVLLLLVIVSVLVRTFQYLAVSGEKISDAQFGTQERWFSDSDDVGHFIKSLLKYDQKVYVWANEPQIYYYAQTLSPSYILHFFQLDNYPNGWEIWERDIYTAKPDYIVTYVSKDEPLYSKLMEYSGINPYEDIKKVGSLRVLQKLK